ncbi:hypothetical protein CULT_340029 [[Clostridium] ultunense Esp]|uniref:Prepilin-type N-terminal cleavage/methylation domain-containing protein n=1 Tax=[Clostridium] ultunense Esp TaxID=1288971 RepID=M1ZCU8_9FIRM|nr:hypothetical protein [Schnuerera ultunensis]CCQ95984.1 hypothetical protein CULT_340029 [[Clostridium] ultunense Esp]SHD77178.1 conserved protein of unknown function [[Clostridium] ultunense Esp]
MNKKGFLLVEILMGLFLLGIIAITCLPILNIGIDNIRMTKDKMDMLLIAESIIEQIKAFDYSWTDDEYVLDMNLQMLIDMFNDSDTIVIRLPLGNNNQEFDYYCTIYKENNSDDLWELNVEVVPIKESKRIKNVNIKTFVSIPKKDEV